MPLCPFPLPFPRLAHKFHGNQPAATASHPNFICCTAAGLLMLFPFSPLLSLSTSPLHFPARLHFVSFSFRESASASSSASCAELKQAEILLPLFMLSLCNILPPAAAVSAAVGAASAAAALGALVFNILQLVKALRSTSLCLQLPLCLCPCSCSCCNGNRSRAVIQITRQMVFLSFASLLQVPFHCFGYWYLKLCINKSISLLSP